MQQAGEFYVPFTRHEYCLLYKGGIFVALLKSLGASLTSKCNNRNAPCLMQTSHVVQDLAAVFIDIESKGPKATMECPLLTIFTPLGNRKPGWHEYSMFVHVCVSDVYSPFHASRVGKNDNSTEVFHQNKIQL